MLSLFFILDYRSDFLSFFPKWNMTISYKHDPPQVSLFISHLTLGRH